MLIHSLFKQESSSMQGIPFLKERFIQSLKKGELLSWQELTRPLEMYEYNKEDMALIKLKMWYEKLTQIDFLKLFQNQSFEEIIIHNEQNAYYIKNGVEYPLDLNYTNEELQILYEVLTLKMGVNWNLKDPFVSFFYQEQNIQLRISLMHFSTSPTKQSKIFIRNIQTQIFRLENFTQNTELITFLTNAILHKKNILISGATGSGKSSLLASLIHEVPCSEHLIILEDTAEIPTDNARHTKMLASEKNEEKSLKSYMSYAMRMRPDRIIIGEMRAKEVTPFILAMNTGHKGLMSSLHANSAVEAISRVALLFSLYSENPDLKYEQILKLVTQNIDYVIHIDRFQIQEVISILGSEKDHCFYEKLF